MVVVVVVVVLVVGGGGVSGRDSFQTTVFAKLRNKRGKSKYHARFSKQQLKESQSLPRVWRKFCWLGIVLWSQTA